MPTSSEPIRQRLTRKLKAAASQLLKQFRTLRRALMHPGVPWYAKAVCGCAVAYVASPIQLIPNFIPIIGQLDDVLVLGLSLRFLKRCCPPAVLEDCQKDVAAFVGVEDFAGNFPNRFAGSSSHSFSAERIAISLSVPPSNPRSP